ncbi:MAG: methyltransferase domain-containing protein [Ardenticatenaceae bacterium]|nr:methyltransferase domain-containing protein [Ardenticatenaceae bacterium]
MSFWYQLLRFGFRLLYHELAWTYDVVSWVVSLGEWRRWQQAALPFMQGQRVLEIGHGPGHILLALQQAGFAVTGLDLSPQMGRLARRRAPSVPLVRGWVQALPFAAGSFDTVLATFPTEYVVDVRTMTAVSRVLGQNGRFLIIPEGHLTTTGPVTRFIEWLFCITGQRQEGGWEPYLAHFRAAGFRVTVEQITFERSAATVVICEKRD